MLLAGNFVGYGVLVLENDPPTDNEFEMVGNAWWHGLIICVGPTNIRLKGGGHTAAHINGALWISDGQVEMNGTTDVTYSSEALANAFTQCLLYRVYSWCDGWGNPL